MRWSLGLAPLVALLGCASEGLAADSYVVRDSETGFTFSEYQAAYAIGAYITYRVAVPTPADSNYDIVYQVIAPNNVGWAGLAWGASMINNPLTVNWNYQNTPVVSVRRNSARTGIHLGIEHGPTPGNSVRQNPQPWTGATVQILKKGSKTNGTHWQITAKCSGCSTFTTTGTNTKNLNPNGSNRLAFAYSKTKPSSASPAGTLGVHDVYGYWDHDFSAAGNANFAQLVTTNA
ncbi:hypothetical protein F5X97DRAFT_327844 [Nemania serpens]|nr:hypothetical protein F5X97DRAFT_327844 [Nemania serpens]